MTTKVLNLYAGIGGNRKLWEDVDVTAVEWDSDKAEVYRDHFPEDTVIEADAHEYLKNHYTEFDFIWASPPCPTHSRLRYTAHQENDPVYPDMKLWQEILFLENTFSGDYAVENVEPYYENLIDGVRRGRHTFWSNFYIPELATELKNGGTTWLTTDQDTGKGRKASLELADRYGFELSAYDFTLEFLRKIVNNCVHPKLGKHVFEAATKNRQTKLFE